MYIITISDRESNRSFISSKATVNNNMVQRFVGG